MSAKTKWWYCGSCGFKNHPRDPRLHGGNEAINENCEQCGAPADHLESIDYNPSGSS
jgi:hypothetical protein